MLTLDNIILIETKTETFSAMQLEIPVLPGVTSKLHMHIMRMDTQQREILPLNKIISINGKAIAKAQTEWKVAGSKGNEYTVVLTGNGYKCNCKGFKFKKHCSHIDEISV